MSPHIIIARGRNGGGMESLQGIVLCAEKRTVRPLGATHNTLAGPECHYRCVPSLPLAPVEA